ncbi:predicted protein [Lichtheimia corymbifera JMRC:FSU:9682]|uniref:Uncharacterized protein n=1 Tax=Lichtheimia corymbifera JMRC:FSU:9682 TaxID=1263082 RepID=A0A068SGY6_9FUNG|nr:predicted protein [Lichtheimia corymbifera JMRC:FSU:9682]
MTGNKYISLLVAYGNNHHQISLLNRTMVLYGMIHLIIRQGRRHGIIIGYSSPCYLAPTIMTTNVTFSIRCSTTLAT